jgi:hypothetical protein
MMTLQRQLAADTIYVLRETLLMRIDRKLRKLADDDGTRKGLILARQIVEETIPDEIH